MLNINVLFCENAYHAIVFILTYWWTITAGIDYSFACRASIIQPLTVSISEFVPENFIYQSLITSDAKLSSTVLSVSSLHFYCLQASN